MVLVAARRLRAISSHTAAPSALRRSVASSASAAALPDDPVVAAGGLAAYAVALADGSASAEGTTADYLARIAALDGQLQCYQHVASASALADAEQVDGSVDVGDSSRPGLRGVPIGVKDIIAIEGMPITCGSALEEHGILDVTSLVGPEGSFVRRLRDAGAILLGKTKTVEFASGGLGINTVRGTPWNPVDMEVHRTPGGSSSGSAAGVAAGLCAVGIGTDTGGSVRIPAALCGIFGLKTSVGRWATDGVLPYSETFDTIGLLTRTAADAAIAFTAIDGGEDAVPPRAARMSSVRLGVPTSFFFENLEPDVSAAIDGALARLEAEGATLVPIDLSAELSEVLTLRVAIVPSEFTQWFGADVVARRETWEAAMPLMGSNVHRNRSGLDVSAGDYLRAVQRVEELRLEVETKMRSAGVAALVTPTVPHTAQPVADYADAEADPSSVGADVGRCVLAGSVWGMCGCSINVQRFSAEATLPVGLQLLCPASEERTVLELALAVEAIAD